MDENKDQTSLGPPNRWQEYAAIAIASLLAIALFSVLISSVIACFYFLPGALKNLCAIPFLFFSKYVLRDNIIETCWLVAIGTLTCWLAYWALMLVMKSAAIHP